MTGLALALVVALQAPPAPPFVPPLPEEERLARELAIWATGMATVAHDEPPPRGFVDVLASPADFDPKTPLAKVLGPLSWSGSRVAMAALARDGEAVAAPKERRLPRPRVVCVKPGQRGAGGFSGSVLVERGDGKVVEVRALLTRSSVTGKLLFAAPPAVSAPFSTVAEAEAASRKQGVIEPCFLADRFDVGTVVVNGNEVGASYRQRSRGVAAADGPTILVKSEALLPDLVRASPQLIDVLADGTDFRGLHSAGADLWSVDADVKAGPALVRLLAQLERASDGKPAFKPAFAWFEGGRASATITFLDATKTMAIRLDWLLRVSGDQVSAALASMPAVGTADAKGPKDATFLVKQKDGTWLAEKPQGAAK